MLVCGRPREPRRSDSRTKPLTPSATSQETVYCESSPPRRWPCPSSHVIYGPSSPRRSLAAPDRASAIGTGGSRRSWRSGLAPPVTTGTTSRSPRSPARPGRAGRQRSSREPRAAMRRSRSSFSAADGPDERRVARSTSSRRPASHLTWDAAGTGADGRPATRLEARHLLHDHDPCRRRSTRAAGRAGQPGPGGLHDPCATGGRIRATERGRQRRRVRDRVHRRRFDGPVDVAAVEARSDRAGGRGRVRDVDRPGAAGTRSRFTPSDGRSRPTPPTRSRSPGRARRRRARPRRRAAGLTVTTTRAPSVVRFRPMTAPTGVDARRASCRSGSRPGWIARARRGACGLTANGAAGQGHRVAGPSGTPSSSSSRPRPCRTGPSSRCSVADTATIAAGTPLDGRRRRSRFRVQEPPKPSRPAARTRRRGTTRAVSRRRLGRRRQLVARRRDVLPAADELHPRTGGWVTSGGDCSSPGGRGDRARSI